MKSDEVYGEGMLNTAQLWEYDTRLGRRWNIDPVLKEWQSPYLAFDNNPIYHSDILGDRTDDPKNKAKSSDFVYKEIELEPNEIRSKPFKKKPVWKSWLSKAKQGLVYSAKAVGAFTVGTVNAVGSNMALGFGRIDSDEAGEFKWFAQAGQNFGDILSVGIGILEGIGGAIGGAVTAPSGVGAVVGFSFSVHGFTTSVIAAKNIINNISKSFDEMRGSGDIMGSIFRHNKQFKDVTRELKIEDKDGFSDFLHLEKDKAGRKGADNYSWQELIELGKKFLENGGY